MLGSLGGEKEGAVLIGHTGFIPFAAEDVGPFVSERVGMGGDGDAGFEFAEDNHAAGGFVFVEDHQLDAGVGAGLPGFIFCERNVRKHGVIEARRDYFASRVFVG